MASLSSTAATSMILAVQLLSCPAVVWIRLRKGLKWFWFSSLGLASSIAAIVLVYARDTIRGEGGVAGGALLLTIVLLPLAGGAVTIDALARAKSHVARQIAYGMIAVALLFLASFYLGLAIAFWIAGATP